MITSSPSLRYNPLAEEFTVTTIQPLMSNTSVSAFVPQVPNNLLDLSIESWTHMTSEARCDVWPGSHADLRSYTEPARRIAPVEIK
jgi:hypothetical protein